MDEPEPTASQAARPAGTLRTPSGPAPGDGRRGRLVRHGAGRAARPRRAAHDAPDAHARAGRRRSTARGENVAYLPGVELPAGLRIEPVSAGAARADYVFLAVPSRALGEAIDSLVAVGLGARTALVSVAKGLVPPTGTPPTLVLSERFGAQRVACLGGPAHAREMVRDGAALVAASLRRGARPRRSPRSSTAPASSASSPTTLSASSWPGRRRTPRRSRPARPKRRG